LNRNYLTDLSLVLVAVIWALNFSIIKVTLEQLDAFSFNGLRFLFAASALYLALKLRGQKLHFHKKDWLPLLGMAVIGNVFYQVTFIIGIDFTLSANAAVMLGTIPVWVALFSHLFTDEKISRINALGVLLAFTGVFLIIAGGKNEPSFASKTFIGDLICVLASMFWAIYTILSKRFLRDYTPLQYSSLMSILGAFILFLIGLPSMIEIDWARVTLPAYGAIFYSGALSVGLAYLIWNNGLVKIGAVRTATYQNLVPVLGLFFGVVLLNEELTWIQYVGASFVISGIILSRR
jgi:drug/metabolite transporter (DMT)-like permease